MQNIDNVKQKCSPEDYLQEIFFFCLNYLYLRLDKLLDMLLDPDHIVSFPWPLCTWLIVNLSLFSIITPRVSFTLHISFVLIKLFEV